jgi:hypothetical protein
MAISRYLITMNFIKSRPLTKLMLEISEENESIAEFLHKTGR